MPTFNLKTIAYKLFVFAFSLTQVCYLSRASGMTYLFIARACLAIALATAGRAIKKSAIVCGCLAVNLAPTRILSEKMPDT